MKFLIISEKYYPEGGGAEFATYLITKILSKYVDVTLISAPGAKPPENARLITMPLYRERIKGHIINSMMITRLKPFIESHDIIYIPRTCYQFIPIAKKLNKKVIVHMHDYYGVTYNSIFWIDEKLGKFPVDHVFYGKWVMGKLCHVFFSIPPSILNKFIDKSLLRYADVIVCPSHFHASLMKKILGIYSGNIVAIYNPLHHNVLNMDLNHEDIRLKFDKRIVTYVGPSRQYKGFETALKIFSLMDDINIRFIGISDKVTLNRIKKMIPRAEIYPKLPHSSYLSRLKESYAVFLPFMTEEPYNYTMIEATLLGNLPVVRRIGVSMEFFESSLVKNFLFSSDAEGFIKLKVAGELDERSYKNVILDGIKSLRNKLNNEKIERKWRRLLEELMAS